MYREAVAAKATETTTLAKESKKMKRASKDASTESGKRATPECAAPVDDLPESSNSKRSKAAAPAVKKVPAGLAGTDGTFTIIATLDDK
jgi:hypothetical protein